MYISWGNPQPWFRPKLSSRGYRITHGTLEVTAGWTAAKISFLNFEPILDSIHLLFWISNPILHQKNEIYIYKFVEVQSSEVRPSFASTLLTTHWLEDNPCFHRKIIDISGEKTKNCPCFPLSNALCVWEERRNSRVLAEKKTGSDWRTYWVLRPVV
jgi:hypothetical protein